MARALSASTHDSLLSSLPAQVSVCLFSSRQELVVALSHLVVQYESNFCTVALQFMEEEKNYPLPSPATTGRTTTGTVLLLLLLLSRCSRVRLCATPWTAAFQAPPPLGFSRQEHWSGLPFPSPMNESGKRK